MRNLYFTLIFLFIGLSINAQEQTKSTVRIVGTPLGYCFYEYKSDIQADGGYSGRQSFNIGLEYGYMLTNSLELSSGVSFYHNKIKSDYFMVDSEGNFTNRSNKYNLNYISIPILGKYKFGSYFFVNGGAILNIRTSDGYFGTFEDKNLGFLLGIGGEYNLNKNIVLSANPFFQINNMDIDSQINFFNGGVKLGIGYRF